MNSTDRKNIKRIFCALAAVPYAQDGWGTKSAGVKGFVDFQKDMRTVRKACEEALFMLAHPDPDKDRAEQEEEFDETMKRAEVFIEMRKAASWE